MTVTEERETLTLRPLRAAVISWASAVVIVVLFTVSALVLRTSDTGVCFRVADQVALVVIGLFFAAGCLLMARPRVRADAEGIEIRNVFVTRRFPWTEVQRVAFPDGASWARIDLPDYEYVPVMAVQAVDGQRAVEAMRRLRALHAAAHAS